MKDRLKKLPKFIQNHRKLLLGGATLCLVLWSCESAASALEQQLDKINALAQGKLLKVGLGVGTVIGTITAILSGSLKLAASIIGIAILLSYFIGWVQSDRFVQGITP
jgi:hypothetical protein